MQHEALSTTLFFTEGSSDKVYSAQLEPKADGWIVNFQYGRRGSSLTAGSKTPDPVEYAKARRIYEKLVSDKTSKGYTPCESGERYQSTENAGRTTGLVPQLLNPVEESEIEALLLDDNWIAQEKADGERRLIIIDTDGITGTNRNGLVVPISARLEAAIASIAASGQLAVSGRTVLDGEDLGDGGFAIFDVLEVNGVCQRSEAYARRYAQIAALICRADSFVQQVKTASGTACKRRLIAELRASNAEGVVFKRLDAVWNAGRPNAGGVALKMKFYDTATVQVGEGRDGKRSVAMFVTGPDGGLVPVGNVTIPANATIPAPGSCIEVRYLYAYAAGSLFQPTWVRARPDKAEPDRLDSLKLKREAAAA